MKEQCQTGTLHNYTYARTQWKDLCSFYAKHYVYFRGYGVHNPLTSVSTQHKTPQRELIRNDKYRSLDIMCTVIIPFFSPAAYDRCDIES
jgi:hypothetical protein